MGKDRGAKSKSTMESSGKNLDTTLEQDAKKRKHNQSQTDISLETDLQLEKIDGNVFELENELSKTKNLVSQLQASLNEQQEQLDREKHFRSVMFARLNDLEQYSRKNNLRIFGIADTDKKESANESEKLVLKLFKEKLGIHWLTQKDIEIAHRTGRYSEHSNRAIIVQLVSRKAKTEIILNRKKLKGTKITIAEDLTIENVRRLKAVNDLDVCAQAWVFGGKIFAKNANEKKIEVRSTDDITENIFEDATNQRTSSIRPEKTPHQQNNSERETPNPPQHKSQNTKEGEKSPKSKAGSSKSQSNIKDSENSENNEVVASQQREQGKAPSNSINSKENNLVNSKASSPVTRKSDDSSFSKKNGDTSGIEMEIGDILSGSTEGITPKHSSTPTDKLKKIIAHKDAIDIRLQMLAGQFTGHQV